jgi:hypothetical protein
VRAELQLARSLVGVLEQECAEWRRQHSTASHRGRNSFLESFERGGHGFGQGAPLRLIDQSGCSRKNFQKFWKIRDLSGSDAATVPWAASSAMRQTGDSPKALAPNLATGQAPVWTANSGRHGNVL